MFKLFLLLLLSQSRAEFTSYFQVYLYGQRNHVAETALNPLNQILKVPASEADLDLRLELKWKAETDQLVLRPRVLSSLKNTDYAAGSEQTGKSQWDLSDAFVEHGWNADAATTFGLQVYQWGPAEFMNPSNPLFHFNSRQKSFVYKEKGQVLVRTNLTLSKEDNLVLIYQPVSNNEPEWIAQDTFQPKALLKYEKSWEHTANYAGFVMGSEEKSNFFIGEYFNYALTDGTSFYADIKHARNSIGFVPVKPEWPTLAVAGVRWEGNQDVRLEYIYNGMGLTSGQLKDTIVVVANPLNPDYIENLQRFLKPGLELLGKNYLYISYRVTEPLKLKELDFYARTVYSLQDSSGQLQLEFDKTFLDSWQVFSSIGLVNGNSNTEFRLINDWQVLGGVKWGM